MTRTAMVAKPAGTEGRLSAEALIGDLELSTSDDAPNHLMPVPTAYQNDRPVNQPSFFSSTTTCTGSAALPPWPDDSSRADPPSAGGV